ncbi:MAG TPA: hypothetical protein ACQGQH_01300 [Xylella sp.]
MDGTIAAGYFEIDSGEDHAAVWKIIYPTQPQPIVVKVDAANTMRTLGDNRDKALGFMLGY